MKNLIIFTTKHGCVEKCSTLLQQKLHGETTMVNLKKDVIPDLEGFQNIILGGSIYVGKIQKDSSNNHFVVGCSRSTVQLVNF